MDIKRRPALTKKQDKTVKNTSNNTYKPSNEKQGVWTTLSKHIMTGISNMIPFLIMGGLILAISQLVPYVLLGVDPSMGIMDAMNSGQFSGFSLSLLKLSQLCLDFGGRLFGFAIPMFAAFMASSIGGKLAFPAGFIGGLMATSPMSLIGLVDGKYALSTPVASSFLGAVIIAIIIGYFVQWLNKTIKVSQNMLAFKTTFLIPLVSAVAVMILMHFVITPIGGALNNMIKTGLEAAGKAGVYGYATALSLATAIDLGGPINKAAGFVALGFATDKVLPITARVIAIVVPSMGLGLATIIDKYVVKRHVFDKQFYPQGKTAIFLAFMGISEGSIPFMLDSPKITIPAYMVGSLVGALTATFLGAVQWFPESAVWAWPLVEKLWAYVVGIIVGALVTALWVIFARNREIEKGKIEVNSNN
ncbi:MAG: PTS fructose transporter subunit IIC [Tissierellia bacterium]|nr:PTS fructose transporter subunit IIC [Tissierellia bacterium]